MPARVHTVVNHTLTAYRTQRGYKCPLGYLIELLFFWVGGGSECSAIKCSTAGRGEGSRGEDGGRRPSGADCKFSVEVRYLEINLLLPW